MVTKKQYRHNTHHADSNKKHYMRLSNNPLSTTTEQTKSLSKYEWKLLNLWRKFIMTQKLNNKLLLDIEINFSRTTYKLKWLSKIQDESNTSNTFSIYTLDHPIHPPPANKELDSKLSRLWRSIFSILRKHKRIPQNLSSTQLHTLSTMRNKEFIYLLPIKMRNSALSHRTLITNWHLTILRITISISTILAFNQTN